MTAAEKQKQIEEVFGKREELNPTLARYLSKDGPMGLPCIKHPLVFSIMHTPEQNAMVNRAFEQKQRAVDEAWAEENWQTFIWMHERPHRIEAFYEAADLMDDETFWSLLGDIWTDSENIWQAEEMWLDMLHADRPGREQMMDEGERETLAQLPSDVEVFRGFCKDGRETGLSWTTDRRRAEWFAQRLALDDDNPRLATAHVKREKIIACFNGRGENEVVVLPEDLERVTTT